MAKVQYMGTGRRKKSVARVRLVPGNGVCVCVCVYGWVGGG